MLLKHFTLECFQMAYCFYARDMRSCHFVVLNSVQFRSLGERIDVGHRLNYFLSVLVLGCKDLCFALCRWLEVYLVLWFQ